MDRIESDAKITPRAVPSGNNRVLLRLGIRLGSARSNPYSHLPFVVSLDHTDRECQPVGDILDRRRNPTGLSLDPEELAGRNRFLLRGVPPPRGCLLLASGSGLMILPRRRPNRWVNFPKLLGPHRRCLTGKRDNVPKWWRARGILKILGNRLGGGGSGKTNYHKKILEIPAQTHGELKKPRRPGGGRGEKFSGRELPTQESKQSLRSMVFVWYCGGRG